VRDVKTRHIDEAQLVIDGLQKNKEMVTIRRDYYASRHFTNAGESAAMGLSIASTVLDAAIAAGYILAGGLKAIPEFVAGGAGFGGSPEVAIQKRRHEYRRCRRSGRQNDLVNRNGARQRRIDCLDRRWLSKTNG
jgi:hypothetical protein